MGTKSDGKPLPAPRETERPFYDPLRIADDEAKIYKAGVSGRYKRTLITRAGFFVLGLMFVGLGLSSLYLAYEFGREVIGAAILPGFLGVGLVYVFGLMMGKVFRK